MRIKISINSIEDLREARDLLDGILTDETAAEPDLNVGAAIEGLLRRHYTLEQIAATVDQMKKDRTPAKKTPAKKAEPAPVKDPEPKEEPERTATEIINAAEAKEEANETSVKVMLAEKIKAGKKAEIRALFTEYGVTKLSELIAQHPDKLAEFAAKAEAIS